MKLTNHPYYCSDSNYYSNDAAMDFETVTDFLNEFEDANIDMNLCFRFDIKEDEDKVLRAEFFLILQRKGIFKPICCRSYTPETESERLEAYLQKHLGTMKKLWTPFTL